MPSGFPRDGNGNLWIYFDRRWSIVHSSFARVLPLQKGHFLLNVAVWFPGSKIENTMTPAIRLSY
jgi:hypothetical protein